MTVSDLTDLPDREIESEKDWYKEAGPSFALERAAPASEASEE